MSDLRVERTGPALTVTFDRPPAHNAMTFAMYEGLHEACERADTEDGVRALVLRGAGEKAFVSGTDIAQFAGFTGADGIAYEQRITRVLRRLQDVTVPTVAAVQGYCIGGGLALAASCDLRIATAAARFGVPIARTLGNCLSIDSYALLVAHLGPARTLDMLLRARLLTGEQAHAAGFVGDLVGDLDGAVAACVEALAGHSPLSMRAAKQAAHRLRRAGLPEGDDLIERVYGSADFAAAVTAFATGERPSWTGG